MLKAGPFQDHADQYDRWFEENQSIYEAELRAVRSFITDNRRSLEVGVGTGRFAVPLGIRIGIEPAESIRAIAGLSLPGQRDGRACAPVSSAG